MSSHDERENKLKSHYAVMLLKRQIQQSLAIWVIGTTFDSLIITMGQRG